MSGSWGKLDRSKNLADLPDPAAARVNLGASGGIWANVKDHGAVGDGVHDDTAALQATIDLGGVTFLPLGRYLHTGLTLRSGSRLVGSASGGYVKNYSPVNQAVVPDAQRCALVLKAGANTDSITIGAGASHGLIQDLEIDGNKAAQTSGSGAGIRLADASSQAEESQWQLNRVYVHDTRQHGLYNGLNRIGTCMSHSVFFACGTNDSTLGSGLVLKGSDCTVDACLIGVCWGDSISLQADVCRIVNTETFSNPTTAATPGNGISIADGVSRCVISGCTIDRSAGHGVYIGFDAINNTLANNVLHSNSQKADASSFHLLVKAGGGGVYNNLLVGNQFTRNDSGAGTNRPNYAIYVDAGAQVYGHGLNVFDAGAYHTTPINNATLYVVPTP